MSPLSSAILYVAIVAIWACVLIPRWLRRDSARGADTAVPGDVVPGDVVDNVAGEDDAVETVWADQPVPIEAPVRTGAPVMTEAAAWAGAEHGDVPEPGDSGGAPPSTPAEARQRMLAARRRLLGIMGVLQVAAIALAVSHLAAMWVLIPPSVMLAGYLLLLREAARGDAERVRREAEAAYERATAQERARERAARRAAAARAGAAPAAAPRPAARYEDAASGGRDFAPGLAGKYTTSNTAVIDSYERSDEEFRDQYTMEKLRAVGD